MTVIVDYRIRLPRPPRRARRIPAGLRTIRRTSATGYRYWMEPTQVLRLHVGDDYRSLYVEETDRLHAYCPPDRGRAYVRRWRGERGPGLVAACGRRAAWLAWRRGKA